jgi:hypothetical protein
MKKQERKYISPWEIYEMFKKSTSSEHKKFEYLVQYYVRGYLTKEDELNKLGKEGWELICIRSDGEKFPVAFIFKRELK